jgi:hypothetical protein
MNLFEWKIKNRTVALGYICRNLAQPTSAFRPTRQSKPNQGTSPPFPAGGSLVDSDWPLAGQEAVEEKAHGVEVPIWGKGSEQLTDGGGWQW